MEHKTHLSFSNERNWILIHQGSPLCDYKKTYDEVMQVVKYYKITLPDVTWNGLLLQQFSKQRFKHGNNRQNCYRCKPCRVCLFNADNRGMGLNTRV